MRLPTIRRLSREEIPDAPEWVDALVYPLNLLFEQLYIGLNKGLTEDENFKGETKTFTITGSSTPEDNTFTFDSGAVTEPASIVLKRIIRSDRVNPSFSQAPWVNAQWTAGKIQVFSIVGLTDGVKYEVTLRISY